MLIKIINENNYMIFEVSEKKNTFKLLEDHGHDKVLNMIFASRTLRDFKSWCSGRCGNLPYDRVIEIAKHNKLKSVKDHLLVEILSET